MTLDEFLSTYRMKKSRKSKYSDGTIEFKGMTLSEFSRKESLSVIPANLPTSFTSFCCGRALVLSDAVVFLFHKNSPNQFCGWLPRARYILMELEEIEKLARDVKEEIRFNIQSINLYQISVLQQNEHIERINQVKQLKEQKNENY